MFEKRNDLRVLATEGMRWHQEVARDLGLTAVLHLAYYGVPYMVFRFVSRLNANETLVQPHATGESNYPSIERSNSRILVAGGAVAAYLAAPILVNFSPRFPSSIKLMVSTVSDSVLTVP